MSKTLNTLLKISQKKLDDQTQVLAEYNNKKQAFLDEKDRLIKSSAEAIDSATDTLSFQMAHNYSQKAKAGVIYIDDQLVKVEELIIQEKDILNKIFLEKKRYEILLENHLKKLKAEQTRKEQLQIDDFNSIRFANKG